MKLNDLIQVGDAIEQIAYGTGCPVSRIINALTGECFDEEEAGYLKSYHSVGHATEQKVAINGGESLGGILYGED